MWQTRYGHLVLLVETFVNPEQFCGTVYSDSGAQSVRENDDGLLLGEACWG